MEQMSTLPSINQNWLKKEEFFDFLTKLTSQRSDDGDRTLSEKQIFSNINLFLNNKFTKVPLSADKIKDLADILNKTKNLDSLSLEEQSKQKCFFDIWTSMSEEEKLLVRDRFFLLCEVIGKEAIPMPNSPHEKPNSRSMDKKYFPFFSICNYLINSMPAQFTKINLIQFFTEVTSEKDKILQKIDILSKHSMLKGIFLRKRDLLDLNTSLEKIVDFELLFFNDNQTLNSFFSAYNKMTEEEKLTFKENVDAICDAIEQFENKQVNKLYDFFKNFNYYIHYYDPLPLTKENFFRFLSLISSNPNSNQPKLQYIIIMLKQFSKTRLEKNIMRFAEMQALDEFIHRKNAQPELKFLNLKDEGNILTSKHETYFNAFVNLLNKLNNEDLKQLRQSTGEINEALKSSSPEILRYYPIFISFFENIFKFVEENLTKLEKNSQNNSVLTLPFFVTTEKLESELRHLVKTFNTSTIIKWLSEKEINLNTLDKKNKNGLLHKLIIELGKQPDKLEDAIKIIEILNSTKKLEINICDTAGNTPYILAAQHLDDEKIRSSIMDKLTILKANPTLKNNEGYDAEHYIKLRKAEAKEEVEPPTKRQKVL